MNLALLVGLSFSVAGLGQPELEVARPNVHSGSNQAARALPRYEHLDDVVPPDVAFGIRESDEAFMFLLDDMPITRYSDWRAEFTDEVFGYGICSDTVRVTEADQRRLADLLTNVGSFADVLKPCLSAPIGAVLFRSPYGKVLVFVDLSCAGVSMHGDHKESRYVHIDPITTQLTEVFAKYFPDAEGVRTNLQKDRR